MSASEFPAGTELVFAENREIEQGNKLDKNMVADHVWNTCRPSSKFSSSMPTVTARRIQLMRIQLQNNPRLFEVWETNVGDLDGEGEVDENDSSDYSSPEQYSGSSSKKRTSDKTSSGSDEVLPAEYSSSSCKKTVDHKHSECLTEPSFIQHCKKKISGTSSLRSENAVLSSLDSRNGVSGKISVCSTKIPSSYRSSPISNKTMSDKSSHRSNNGSPAQQSSYRSRRAVTEKASVSSVHGSQALYSSTGSRKRVGGRSSECSAESQQYSKQNSKRASQKSTAWPENVSPGQRNNCNSNKVLSETFSVHGTDATKMSTKHSQSSDSSPASSNGSADVCPEYMPEMDNMEIEETCCDENGENKYLRPGIAKGSYECLDDDEEYEGDGDMGEEDEDDSDENEEDEVYEEEFNVKEIT